MLSTRSLSRLCAEICIMRSYYSSTFVYFLGVSRINQSSVAPKWLLGLRKFVFRMVQHPHAR